MDLKAIIFDLDNTLIDFLTFKKETAKVAATAMVREGLPLTEIQTYGKIFSVYDEKGIDYQKTFRDVIEPFGFDVNKAERIQQAAIVTYLKRKFEVLKPYPMVYLTLEKLRKRYKLAIVTVAPRNKAWQRLVFTNLQNEFDIVISKDDAEEKKESGFDIAAQRLGFAAEECMYVGDNAERDILQAKEIGMKTCWAKYGSMRKTSETKADFEIDRFEDLLKIIKG
ncbi:MAG: HAD-IA family hydrolase [Candidatus Micrarchaeota archaeon]